MTATPRIEAWFDHYRREHPSSIDAHRVAGHTGARITHLSQAAGDWSVGATPDLRIALVLSGGRIEADFGAGTFTERLLPGVVGVAPPNVSTRIIQDQAHEVRVLTVPYRALGEVAGDVIPPDGDFGGLHLGYLRDQQLSALLGSLWTQAGHGHPFGSLYADGTLLHVVGRLVELRDGVGQQAASLSDRRLRKAVRYLEDRLAEDVGVIELARVAGVSPTQLTVLFRDATGLPPHRWLMRRRLEHARDLLARSRGSVTEIAMRCGFASSQHLATAFRRQYGITPSAHRRAQRA